MKSEKGITLTALAIYIIIIIAVLGILATLNNVYEKNVDKMRQESTAVAEYNKFNLYFLKEIKKTNNKIVAVYSASNVKTDIANVTTDTFVDKIQFETGSIFYYSAGSIYIIEKGNTFEIANNIEKVDDTGIFKVSADHKTITVTVVLDEAQMSTNYELQNTTQTTTVEDENLYYSNNVNNI